MAGTAKKTDPKLWDKVKKEVTDGDKGGKPKQWSARKAQMATAEYKKEGGGYDGAKADDNHLSHWTKEDWGTKSGAKSGETGGALPAQRGALVADGFRVQAQHGEEAGGHGEGQAVLGAAEGRGEEDR